MIVDCPPSLGSAHPQRPHRGPPGRAGDRPDDVRGVRRAAGLRRGADRAPARQPRPAAARRARSTGCARATPNTSSASRSCASCSARWCSASVLPDRSAIQQAQGACLPIQRWDTPGAREAVGGVHACCSAGCCAASTGRTARSPPHHAAPPRTRRPAEIAASRHHAGGDRRACRSRRSRLAAQRSAAPRAAAVADDARRTARTGAAGRRPRARPTSRAMPASAAALVSEQEAKNAAHSASSGATSPSSCQTLRLRAALRARPGPHRQHRRGRPQRSQVGGRVAQQRIVLAVGLGQPVGGLAQQAERGAGVVRRRAGARGGARGEGRRGWRGHRCSCDAGTRSVRRRRGSSCVHHRDLGRAGPRSSGSSATRPGPTRRARPASASTNSRGGRLRLPRRARHAPASSAAGRRRPAWATGTATATPRSTARARR